MFALVDVFKNTPAPVRRELSRLLKGDAAARVAAAHALAALGHRPAAMVMRGRLRDASLEVVEALLRGIHILAPEMARDAALDVCCDSRPAHATLGKAFLDSLERLGHLTDDRILPALIRHARRML